MGLIVEKGFLMKIKYEHTMQFNKTIIFASGDLAKQSAEMMTNLTNVLPSTRWPLITVKKLKAIKVQSLHCSE